MTEADLDRAIQCLEELGFGLPDNERVPAHDLAEQEIEEASLRVALARSQYEISMPSVDLGIPADQSSKRMKSRSTINPSVNTCGKGSSSTIPASNPATNACGKGSAVPAPNMGCTLISQATNNAPSLMLAPQPIRSPPITPADGRRSGTSNQKYYTVAIGRCIGVYDYWYVL